MPQIPDNIPHPPLLTLNQRFIILLILNLLSLQFLTLHLSYHILRKLVRCKGCQSVGNIPTHRLERSPRTRLDYQPVLACVRLGNRLVVVQLHGFEVVGVAQLVEECLEDLRGGLVRRVEEVAVELVVDVEPRHYFQLHHYEK